MVENLKRVVIDKGKITLHDGGEEFFLDINSIVYCKADANYSDIFTVERPFKNIRIQIGQLNRLIEENSKMLDQKIERIGRSLLINLDCVRSVNAKKRQFVMHVREGKDEIVDVKRADVKHLISKMKELQKSEYSDSEKKIAKRDKDDGIPLFYGVKGENRKWSDEELEWCKELYENGYSYSEIAISIRRTKDSVQSKMNEMLKMTNAYNSQHIEEKFRVNVEFADSVINSHSGSNRHFKILDLYCGYNGFWNQYAESKKNIRIDVTTNDKNPEIKADYNEDAERLIHKLYYEKNMYDIVDIDPFGSPYECLELGVKMAKRGLCVTFGDLKLKQWGCLDFMRDRYGIETKDEMNVDSLIAYVKKVGRRNGKTLEVFHQSVWNKLARVWFRVKEDS